MFLTVAVAFATVFKASAGDNPGVNPFLGVLTTATSAELPAKAGELVSQADAKTLKQTTIDVVKAAVGLNPAAAPAIVGSIAQASPAMTVTASATAVALVPNQAVVIARAAASAVPAKAGAIVEAICRVVPADYQKVATAVAEVVPGAGEQILAGVAAAIPELKMAISQTLVSYDGKIPSVTAVLTQVAQTESSTLAATPLTGTPNLPRGPSATPPQVPISGTLPPPLNPGTGTPVPPGGHNYSAP